MRRLWSDRFRKLSYPWLFAGMLLPVGVLVRAFGPASAEMILWMTNGIFLLLGMLTMLLPGSLRLAAGIIGAIMLPAAALVSSGFSLMLFYPLVFSVILLLQLKLAAYKEYEEPQSYLSIVSFFFYLVAELILSRNAALQGTPLQETMLTLLRLGCIVHMLMSFLLMNRVSLGEAAMAGSAVNSSMRRKNLALTLLLLVVSIGIASIRTLAEWASVLGNGLFQVVLRAILWLLTLFKPVENAPDGSGSSPAMDGLPDAAGTAPSRFWKIAAQVFAILLIVAAIVYLIRLIVKKLPVLFAKLGDKLSAFAHDASEDYVDEVVQLKHDEAFASAGKEGRRPFIRRRPSDPSSRIREAYRRIRFRRRWNDASTARENLRTSAAGIYEKARYSAEIVAAEEADHFEKTLEEMK